MAPPDGNGSDPPATTETPAGHAAEGAPGRNRASGIYGTIVTAAVIAAGGNHLTTAALEVTVLVTLIVYWLSEQYAELLGEHTRGGHLPSRLTVRHSLADAWPMVTSSFLPLISLAAARLLGAAAPRAADVALAVTLVLLLLHGHAAGKAAGLIGGRLLLATGTAGLLGAAMVVLKALVSQHH